MNKEQSLKDTIEQRNKILTKKLQELKDAVKEEHQHRGKHTE